MYPSTCRSRIVTWIALLLVGGMCALPVQATTYFVATNGSDTNPGTNLAAPFRTIKHATTVMGAGDTCYLRGGVYHEALLPFHCGTGNAPITFAAYSNEVVTISGADAVTNWTFLSNGIYQASIGWNLGEGYNQVFVDGAMIHEAQYPDYGSGDLLHPTTVSVVVNNTNTALITSTAWSGKPDNYWAGAWFLGGVGYSWSWQCARVVSSTGDTITVDPATESTPWFSGNGKGILWGAPNLLDADNEWYLQTNSTGNTLYLRITGGGDPSTHLVEMKRRAWCVFDSSGLSNIVVSNLNLQAGAVLLDGANNVLENCTAQFLSHFLRFSNGYAENGNLQQGGGIVVGGTNNMVRNCTIFNTAGSGIYCNGRNNLITRNLIYNTDYSGTYACCLALHGSRNTVIFNTAHTSGRSILRPGGAGDDICFNDLSDPGLLCRDLGVIYIWGVNARDASGTSTRIAYNWIHDNNHPVPAPLIYLDNYCAYFLVDHNVCWNTGGDSGIRINRPALGHQIYNNTLFNCDDVGTHTYDSWANNNNPDPTFWTNDVYQYSASNNLFLSTSPQSQLVNWTNEDFQLQSNAPAINAGVVIPGFTDGYVGSAPDLGAYEFGDLPWSAGVASKPTLTVAGFDNHNLVLTASPDAAYYQLYASTNLASPHWTLVTNTPLALANEWSVTPPVATNTSCFYRLQQ